MNDIESKMSIDVKISHFEINGVQIPAFYYDHPSDMPEELYPEYVLKPVESNTSLWELKVYKTKRLNDGRMVVRTGIIPDLPKGLIVVDKRPFRFGFQCDRTVLITLDDGELALDITGSYEQLFRPGTHLCNIMPVLMPYYEPYFVKREK